MALFFWGLPAWGQVQIQKILSPSKINSYRSQHLVLIDFWATWCTPCVYIGRQLEITQEIFKDDLTIISLSNENEPVVQQFIDTYHPKLMIALDAEDRTFRRYGVTDHLPYAVLLNQRGETLWQGHPADLTKAMLTRFIQRNKNVTGTPASKLITVVEETIAPPAPAGTQTFSVRFSALKASHFTVTAEGIEFLGRASRLFSEMLKKSRHDIRVANDPVIEVRIPARDWNAGSEAVLDRVLKELKMTRQVVSEESKFYLLSVLDRKRLWSNRRIDLGGAQGSYLLGGETLSVDNATIEEFAFRLSEVMEYPVYTFYDSPVRRDWVVQYKRLDRAKQQLAAEFGLLLEIKYGPHEVYLFK
jgi:thiol-disulfide isomerase/thioredoxin